MKPFHTIAIPHDDILQGRLTLDVFAADLWEVYHGRGPEEYRDAHLFFQKTYLTEGLQHLLAVVEKRLKGQGGDPVIQMQTPFGGGKTHSLIALYHKAHEWGVKTVVISGTPLSGKDTLWGVIAQQLTGSQDGFEGQTAPGREAIHHLLAQHQPVLLLLDELLEYVTKAAGVMVGESTLAGQTLAFMQELTEAAAVLDRVALVIALPSSTLEQYDEQASRLFEQLKKISGRVEKIYTPVQDDEVGAIIRRRLFASVDENAAMQVINAFLEQAEREAIISRGEESARYRAHFKQTYPFLPEVVDVLYHRWGSFPTFQRTRGTLRLLAMVISTLKNLPQSYISLADFTLNDREIRRELLKHIGNEYDSVLAADIVGQEAGARRASQEIGKAYQGLGMGERIATTIFMYSFLGGGGEGGAILGEIKRQNLVAGVPASVITEVLQKLSSKMLFYLHESNSRYYFSTTANLNRALTIRMENLSVEELQNAELNILRERISGKGMKTFIWPQNPNDIADDELPKLLVLPEADEQIMKRFINEKGQTRRVHRNTLFFLAPSRSQKNQFDALLRRWLAISSLLNEKTLSLTKEQLQELQTDEKQAHNDLREQIGRLYRLLYLPGRDEVTLVDMGIPTYGIAKPLEELVYQRLRSEGRLVEKFAPLVIKERYLANRDFIETQQLAESGSRTPGEMLTINRNVWISSIIEGVRQGLFGLGELDQNEKPRCLYFKEEASVSLQGREILMRAEICAAQKERREDIFPIVDETKQPKNQTGETQAVVEVIVPSISNEITKPFSRQSLTLQFSLPQGKLSDLMSLLSFLQQRFEEMNFSIAFSKGMISEEEIDMKVREAFRQMGIDVKIL